jgi:hypothetical protein
MIIEEKTAVTDGRLARVRMTIQCPQKRAAAIVETNVLVMRWQTKTRLLIGDRQKPNPHARTVRAGVTGMKWTKTKITSPLPRVLKAPIERLAGLLGMKTMKALPTEKKRVSVRQLVKPSGLLRWPLSEQLLRQNAKHELRPRHSP